MVTSVWLHIYCCAEFSVAIGALGADVPWPGAMAVETLNVASSEPATASCFASACDKTGAQLQGVAVGNALGRVATHLGERDIVSFLKLGVLASGGTDLFTPWSGWSQILADSAVSISFLAIANLLANSLNRAQQRRQGAMLVLCTCGLASWGMLQFYAAVRNWGPGMEHVALMEGVTGVVSLVAAGMVGHRVFSRTGGGHAEGKGSWTSIGPDGRSAATEPIRLLLDSVPTSLIMIDGNNQIVLVNRAAIQMFGYPCEESLLGQPVEVLVPERSRDRHAQLVGQYLAHPGVRSMGHGRDLVARRHDGTEFPVEIGLCPMPDPAGQSASDGAWVLASVVDLSLRKRSECELLEHAKALEQRNEELDQFTYFASHDLQEPLRKLVSFSSLLRADLSEDLPERAAQDLHFISTAAKRMATLVQDLLRLSRSGRGEWSPEEIALDECLDAALEELKPQISESHVRIERGPLPRVVVDRVLVVQLLQNLIGNAIKYRSPDRPVTIQVQANEESGEWVYSVSDNGIGIQPQYMQQIFLPFKRLHGREEYEGNGIGLAICRRVVERHGGRIWVESKFGEGSTFKFTMGKSAEQKRWSRSPGLEPTCC